MNIGKCMKRNVFSIPEASTIREAASVFVKQHIGLLPIVDSNNRLVGMVGLRDLLTLQLPDFVSFVADVDFVHDFGMDEKLAGVASRVEIGIAILSTWAKVD